MQNRAIQPEVIIIGAGPVGLMTAIQIKLLDPEKQILMLEKYPDYQRKHSLLLDKNAFSNAHPHPELQQIIKELPTKVRTNELENKLLAFAKKIGIEIHYQALTDCKTLIDNYKNTPIVIGADGSHSIIRKQIFHDEYQFYYDMQYLAEIKYDVKGKAHPLNTLEKIAATHFEHHFPTEFIGEPTNDITPVAIRFLINEDTYEKMKEATFKNPYTLTQQDKIDKALFESINAWLIAREDMRNEEKINGSERITTTHLPCYASKSFTKEQAGKTWFLVGDAAIGMPYFRGMRNGIKASIKLAHAIHANDHHLYMAPNYYDSLSTLSLHHLSPIEHYEQYMQTLSQSENTLAIIKNPGVQSFKGTAKLSQAMPMPASFALTQETRHYKIRMQEETNDNNHYSVSTLSFLNKSISEKSTQLESEKKDKLSLDCRIL